ncbi:replication initiation protein [Spiroplasma endosymbiont of Danaus chrysippus]|uniref:replication initiation protein n=1 Tax=Spiroplasma endosymbiont of Danaus chrysippus TaxID=2691041 RepID=UPI00157A8751|nr:replication initiation protein [Spiroplasma endosymbiont of Danaus chrysippus]
METKETNKLTVKYDNELNSIAFHRLNAKELDLFFTFCAKLKEKGTRKLFFTFSELKKIIQFEPTSKQRFVNVADKLYEKMLTFTINSTDGTKRTRYNLFSGYEIDEKKQELQISVNPDLMYLINNLVTREYTLFEHQEFVNIKSTYAKNCYRLLKQFRSTGFCKIKINDFRNLLDIPKNYNMCDIDKRVLKPINNELKLLFKNLIIKKIKKQIKVEYIEFNFNKQLRIKSNLNKIKTSNLTNITKLQLNSNSIVLSDNFDEVVWDYND